MKNSGFLMLILGFSSILMVYCQKRNPTLLISLDGFRADKLDEYLLQNPNSAFSKLINNGVKADYMLPSFPSVTFPNHWTLITGLYPESHGITGNAFYDSEIGQIAALIGGANALDIRWWNLTDPIWVTARKHGLKTASSFWPGSEIWTRNPDIYLTYNSNYVYEDRVDELVNWFKKFEIDFATIYFNQPDSDGHSYGPDSPEYKAMIVRVDSVIGHLIKNLENENLYDKINIILTSDHGMAKIENKNDIILITNFIDIRKINSNKTIYGEVSNIYPASQDLENEVYMTLKTIPNVKVYLKKDVPQEYHYSNGNRIAPIVAIADEGYYLTNNPNLNYYPGHHGYNNSLVSMRTIFMAKGPNFKSNVTIGPFINVNVYPLLCNLLKIECLPNNGTIEVFSQVLSPSVFSGSNKQLFLISKFNSILYAFATIFSYYFFYFK